MPHPRRTLVVLTVLATTLVACKAERAKVDSAAGAMSEAVKATLSVIDIDMGRHIDTAKKISDKTDDFAPTDTIYGSVHTSGTATDGAVIGRWTFQDGSVLDERQTAVTTAGDAYTAFFIANPKGLTKGTYTLHVIIDGKEVRTKDVTVK